MDLMSATLTFDDCHVKPTSTQDIQQWLLNHGVSLSQLVEVAQCAATALGICELKDVESESQVACGAYWEKLSGRTATRVKRNKKTIYRVLKPEEQTDAIAKVCARNNMPVFLVLTHTHTHIHTHTHTHTLAHTHPRTHTNTHTHPHINTHTHTHTHTHARTHTHHPRTHTHTHTHTHIHAHTYTHAQVSPVFYT